MIDMDQYFVVSRVTINRGDWSTGNAYVYLSNSASSSSGKQFYCGELTSEHTMELHCPAHSVKYRYIWVYGVAGHLSVCSVDARYE